MEASKNSIPKISAIAGVIMCALLIVYFLLMKQMNLIQSLEMRFLNIVILIGVLVTTFKYYRRKTNLLNIPYFQGLSLGILTSSIGFMLFAIFMYNYLTYDPSLFLLMKGSTLMMGFGSLTPGYAAFTIIVQGCIAGLIVSFAIIQFYYVGFHKTKEQKKLETS